MNFETTEIDPLFTKTNEVLFNQKYECCTLTKKCCKKYKKSKRCKKCPNE